MSARPLSRLLSLLIILAAPALAQDGTKLAADGTWSAPISTLRDEVPPTGLIKIFQTPAAPPPGTVHLDLSGITDPGSTPSGLYQVRFRFSGLSTWSHWEPFANFKTAVSDHAATTLSVQVSDHAGNVATLSLSVNVTAVPAVYVDDDNTSGPWNGSPANPFRTIQAGINDAYAGSMGTVIVMPGTYQECTTISGNLVLRSADPNLEAVVKTTIIDARQKGSVVTFKGTETSATLLAGFTLTGGKALKGAGINGRNTQATIEHNRILGNQAYHMTSVAQGNFPYMSFDIYESGYGGGLANCKGAIRNNVIAGNNASRTQPPVIGKPLVKPSGPPTNFYHFSYAGGALYQCTGNIENNTIDNNRTESSGNLDSLPLTPNSSISGCSGTFRNNIVNNQLDEVGLETVTHPIYCCIRKGAGGGTGNIYADPKLQDPAHGDFHLRPDSPCLDAGMRIAGLLNDMDGQARGFNGTILPRGDGSDYDIGADEYVVAPFNDVRPEHWSLYR